MKKFIPIAALALLAACGAQPAVADAPGVPGSATLPEGISVVTDQGTGCEYLYVPGHALTPRTEYNNSGGMIQKGCR